MKAILGTVPLTEGEVFWKGSPITKMPTAWRIRAGLGAVPEARRIFPRLTVEENLLVGAATRTDAQAIRRDVLAMYELFPRLEERREQTGGSLSGGEQQMLALARALMSQPALLCMDEPSMGLSPLLVRQSFSLIRRLRERGIAVFVIEQNAKAALSVAEYAYVLHAGEVALEGPAADVLTHPAMVEAYLGKTALPPSAVQGV
jgi:branched-chain amino acid transport system ATP-binding protein